MLHKYGKSLSLLIKKNDNLLNIIGMATTKKILDKYKLNLLRSLNVIDFRYFHKTLSKKDVYILNNFNELDFFHTISESDQYLTLKRKFDFYVLYVNNENENQLVKCFCDVSYFLIDKVSLNVCIILHDIKKVIEVNSNGQNVIIGNHDVVNRIYNNIIVGVLNNNVDSKVHVMNSSSN